MPIEGEVVELDGTLDIDAQLPAFSDGVFESFDLDFDFGVQAPEATLFMPDEDYVVAQVPAVGMDGAFDMAVGFDAQLQQLQMDAGFDALFGAETFLQYVAVLVTSDPDALWYVGADDDIGRAQRLHDKQVEGEIGDSDQP